VDIFGDIFGDVIASRWEFDDGTTLSNRPFASRSWAVAGDYPLVLRAFNADNPGGITATAWVHVVTIPTHFVDSGSLTPQPPYSSWATAATNIQDAIDASTLPGAVILVTNGVYQAGGRAVYSVMTNRVAVTKPVTVQGVNGPNFTTIVGDNGVRCVYLTNQAALTGFTLSNGVTIASTDQVQGQSGGGVWCASAACVISNCVFTGNHATYSGGGVFQGTLLQCTLSNNFAANGGGIENGVLDSCLLVGNTASSSGGGAENGTLTNCLLFGNSAANGGGGVSQASLVDCTISSNSASGGGGSYAGKLSRCTLSGNSAASGGGASGGVLDHCSLLNNTALFSLGGGGTYGSTLTYCLISSNYASYGGGVANAVLSNCTLIWNTAYNGGGAFASTVNNCAIALNTASNIGGGISSGMLNNCTVIGNSAGTGGGAFDTPANNSILFYNMATDGPNYATDYPPRPMNYCCTTPLPAAGVGTFEDDPQLASFSHISSASPCRGAGSALYAAGLDIDGEPWANPPSVGCDEPYATGDPGPITVAFQASCTNFGTNYSVYFVGNIFGDVSASRWDFGDGTILSNRPYASHAWAVGGDYVVVLRAYNSANPAGVAATLTVHVVSQPVYVSLISPSPSPPYDSWMTAATNLNDGVDVAVPGGLVLVTNGLYAAGGRIVFGAVLSNRLAITKPIFVASVNGPAVTVIQGFQVPGAINADGAVRCAYVTNGAALIGFTLTNGATRAYGAGDSTREQSGGGVLCETGAFVSGCWIMHNSAASAGGGSYSGILSNCLLTGNSSVSGGAVYGGNLIICSVLSNSASYGGGANAATLLSSVVSGNSSGQGGGAYSCSLTNCVLLSNTVAGAGLAGGADESYLDGCVLGGNTAYVGGGVWRGSLSRCTLTNNLATYGAGADSATLDRCWLINNSATDSGGGVEAGTVNNSIFLYNSATNDGGGAYHSTLNNCTLIGNRAAWGGGAFSGALNNSIAYYNVAPTDANCSQEDGFASTLNYCCTVPGGTNGFGNITNEPLFVLLSGNLRLQPNSPCINSGNNAYAPFGLDLDGNPRIAGGSVDIGAYEFQHPTSIISYAWLQQYGMATDGSADFGDPDGDGFNNWQEWVCGTDPTNDLSVLRLISATPTGTGVIVTWQSVGGLSYFLEGTDNLVSPLALLATNIVGQAGITSYTDTSASEAGPFFYRVGVNKP
jgi:hypothetical protein